jgi:hypothetical protein
MKAESKIVGLVRVVQILEIKLIAEVNKRKRVLMESEQNDQSGAGGCKREQATGPRFIVVKIPDGEDWQAALPLALADKFGIEPEKQIDCISVDNDTKYKEEVVPSEDFAGIMSTYKITTIAAYVIDPDHEALESIGLPRGNDFVTKEFTSSGAPAMHVWTWGVAVDETDSGGNFGGTALEVLNRGLIDVETMLMQTIADPRLASCGLDKPFKTSLLKLKKCVERLSNIEKTVKSVDINDLMGERRGSRDVEVKTLSGLSGFIRANFVAADQPENETQKARKKFSSLDMGLTAGDLSGFRLENLFGDAPPILQTIM